MRHSRISKSILLAFSEIAVLLLLGVGVATPRGLPGHVVRAARAAVQVGSVHRYATQSKALTSIIVGPDNNIWFGASNREYFSGHPVPYLGRLDPVSKVLAKFPTMDDNSEIVAVSLVAGPDGNIWMALGENCCLSFLASSTTSGTITTYGPGDGYLMMHPIVGPDGQIWGPSCQDGPCDTPGLWGKMARFDIKSHQYSMNSIPTSENEGAMTLGPNGNFWYCSAPSRSNSSIDEATPAGLVVGSFPTTPYEGCGQNGGPYESNLEIVYGPDGNIYSNADNGLTGTTPSGVSTVVVGHRKIIQLEADAVDGSIWFIVNHRPLIYEYVIATKKLTAYPTTQNRIVTFAVDHLHNSVWFGQHPGNGLFQLIIPSSS
jgi:hypothetical protein